METNFNFKSQVATSREQSERLLALGLKKETADCHWYKPAEFEHDYWYEGIGESWATSDIPAWSLHRLIEMIHDVCSRIIMVHSWVRIEDRYMSYIDYSCDRFDNTYDNLISCIEWLIKEGYFNKEYLV